MKNTEAHPNIEIWRTLFAKALALLDDLEKRVGSEVHWTFGGGTVLMLRYQHRVSKDIDIFFRDPQPLAYLTPRTGELSELLTGEYQESANHLKLLFDEGEIDFVASPNLTDPGFEVSVIDGRSIRMETPVEIIAKKMWHRGDAVKARDLFDFGVVIEHAGEELREAAHFLIKNREPFLTQLKDRQDILRTQYEQIDALKYDHSFDDCASKVSAFLLALR